MSDAIPKYYRCTHTPDNPYAIFVGTVIRVDDHWKKVNYKSLCSQGFKFKPATEEEYEKHKLSEALK